MKIPTDLRDLYFETNGVYLTDAYDWRVFSVERLVKVNIYMHTSPDIADYAKPVSDLLYFGSLGNGDLAAFRIDPDLGTIQSVGIWDHEDGEYREYAGSLREYMER